MGFYTDRVLPRVTNLMLGDSEHAVIRARVASGLEGEVLEIGFGSGLNVPHYPRAVTRVQAIEPAAGGRALAARRVAASPVPVQYAGLDGQALPAASGSVDCVLSTWTMCTIPDIETALREMHRVLRPGGRLLFAEHGLSPDPRIARWQRRLNPLQRLAFGGCHLNRPIDRLVRDTGFSLTRLDNYYVSGPKVSGYNFEGVAVKA
jgi:ubiquinone/menaquinone biosynthesis C-methylase UbiE